MWLMLSVGSSGFPCFSRSGDARMLRMFWLNWTANWERFIFLYVMGCTPFFELFYVEAEAVCFLLACPEWPISLGSVMDRFRETDVFDSESFLIFNFLSACVLFWKKLCCFTPCGYVWKHDEISRLCLGVFDESFFNSRGFEVKMDCETFGVLAMWSVDLFRPRIVRNFSILASFLLRYLAIGLSVCVPYSDVIGFLRIRN